jgi:hypothetical protein
MKISLFVVCAAAFLTSGAVVADEDTVVADEVTTESTPIELSAAQMDQITAGSLTLNNGTGGKVIFDGFDNPAPNVNGYLADILGGLCDPAVGGAFCHPALNRRSDSALASVNAPSGNPFGNDGPWVATIVSGGVITCDDCP